MNNPLKHSAQRVQDVLRQHGLITKVIEFKELTRTAEEAASAIGCKVGQIAKTLIFRAKDSRDPVCIIASGSNAVLSDSLARYFVVLISLYLSLWENVFISLYITS